MCCEKTVINVNYTFTKHAYEPFVSLDMTKNAQHYYMLLALQLKLIKLNKLYYVYLKLKSETMTFKNIALTVSVHISMPNESYSLIQN